MDSVWFGVVVLSTLLGSFVGGTFFGIWIVGRSRKGEE